MTGHDLTDAEVAERLNLFRARMRRTDNGIGLPPISEEDARRAREFSERSVDETIDPDLEAMLRSEGYIALRLMPDGHIAGVNPFAFTFGLCTRLDWNGYEDRWCFEQPADALLALVLWNGEGDPPGPWIKRKGGPEYCNPKLFDVVGVNRDGSKHYQRKAEVDAAGLWV